jgi:hypothetical protein
VEETEFCLNPATIELDRLGTYTFRAVELRQHLARPGDRERRYRGGNLEPGTFEIYCPVSDHEERGMAGTVPIREP